MLNVTWHEHHQRRFHSLPRNIPISSSVCLAKTTMISCVRDKAVEKNHYHRPRVKFKRSTHTKEEEESLKKTLFLLLLHPPFPPPATATTTTPVLTMIAAFKGRPGIHVEIESETDARAFEWCKEEMKLRARFEERKAQTGGWERDSRVREYEYELNQVWVWKEPKLEWWDKFSGVGIWQQQSNLIIIKWKESVLAETSAALQFERTMHKMSICKHFDPITI